MVLLHSVAGGCFLGDASRVGAAQVSPLRVLCGFLACPWQFVWGCAAWFQRAVGEPPCVLSR
eukprot:2662890-Alexandrium_andersonii.AAC.1